MLAFGSIQHRHALPAEDDGGRSVSLEQGHTPCFHGLRGVSWTDNSQVGNSTQVHHLLYGLVRRAVLTEANTVMGKDVDDPNF